MSYLLEQTGLFLIQLARFPIEIKRLRVGRLISSEQHCKRLKVRGDKLKWERKLMSSDEDYLLLSKDDQLNEIFSLPNETLNFLGWTTVTFQYAWLVIQGGKHGIEFGSVKMGGLALHRHREARKIFKNPGHKTREIK